MMKGKELSHGAHGGEKEEDGKLGG